MSGSVSEGEREGASTVVVGGEQEHAGQSLGRGRAIAFAALCDGQVHASRALAGIVTENCLEERESGRHASLLRVEHSEIGCGGGVPRIDVESLLVLLCGGVLIAGGLLEESELSVQVGIGGLARIGFLGLLEELDRTLASSAIAAQRELRPGDALVAEGRRAAADGNEIGGGGALEGLAGDLYTVISDLLVGDVFRFLARHVARGAVAILGVMVGGQGRVTG